MKTHKIKKIGANLLSIYIVLTEFIHLAKFKLNGYSNTTYSKFDFNSNELQKRVTVKHS